MAKYTLFAMNTPKKGVCKVGMAQKICTYENGAWRTDKATGISHINAVIIDGGGATWAFGEQGDVFRIKEGEKNKKYEIAEAGKGQGKFGVLLNAAYIEDTVYICGHGRQIYKKSGDEFIRFDEGVRPDVKDNFTWLGAIAGLSEDTLHAVGNKGQIWNYDGNKWSVNTPTNEHLQAIAALGDGTFYVAGYNGTVLRGFRDKWEKIECKYTFECDFMSIASFQDKIYLSSYNGMFVIENNIVKEIDPGHKVQGRILMSNGDELWAKDSGELWRFDGATWDKIEMQ